MVSWHGSIVLRTLLRLKELVWRLDHWVGFRDCFKNHARHLLQTKPSLTAVTTTASAACHRMQAHCAWVLSALPRRRVARYLGCATRHPTPRPALVPLTRRGCTRVGRPPAATITSASHRALVSCLALSTVT